MDVDSPYASLLAEAPPTVASTRVLGGLTRYWTYGRADAATTVILVHGYRGEHHGLEPVVAHLRGLKIISPDLPGFGESSTLDGRRHDIDGYSAWLTAFVESVAPRGEAVIVGHSFGSIVSSAAVAGGLRVPRLILINPIAAPALDGSNAAMSKLTLAYYRAGRALPEKLGRSLLSNWLIVRFMSTFLTRSRDRPLRRWIHDQHRQYFSRYSSRDSVVEGFEASITSDVSMFAKSITVPTLLIGADRDPISSEVAQRRLLDLFPQARLEMLRDVGHLVHYERPADAARLIVDFLGDGKVAEE